MVTLGRTVSLSGVRRSDPRDTFVVAWLVSSTVTSGLGGERVDYMVSINGVPWKSRSATQRDVVRPNFSGEASRMPGVVSGMAPFGGYQAIIECDQMPGGSIVVDAVAQGHDGTSKVLQSCTIYNDADRGEELAPDRRPSTRTTYCDAQAGDDSNSGADWSNAVRTMDRAIYLSQKTPGGTSSADRDCGGAVIHARGDFIGGGGGTAFPWHCSGEWWLQIVADDEGMTWGRQNQPWFTEGADDVCMQGNGAGTYTRLRVTGCRWVGSGPVGLVGAGTLARVWREGGTSGSAHFVADGKASVRWADDTQNAVWSFRAANQADADAGRVYVTGEVRQGAVFGYGAEHLAYDCEVHGWLMNPYFVVGPQKGNCVLSGVAHLQRYSPGPNGVQGWVRHVGGTGFEVQVLGGGVMRILGPVGGYDFGRDAAGIGSSPRWGVGCYGFASAANNSGTPNGAAYTSTNGAFRYLGNGVVGGRSYVDVENPSAVVEMGVDGALLETSERQPWAGGPGGFLAPYNQVVHTNGFSIGPNREGDDIVRDVAIYDCTGAAQSVFFNGADHHHLLLENLRGPGDGKQVSMVNGNVTQTLIRSCTFTGPLFLNRFTPGELPVLDFTGLEIIHCVFGSFISSVPEVLGLGATIDSCHWLAGAPLGTNAVVGSPWFAGNHLAAPWSFQPHATYIGNGNPVLAELPAWAWSPTGTTRGVQKNVGLVTWATGSSPTGIDVQASPAEVSLQSATPTVVVGAITVGATSSAFSLATVSPAALVGAVAAEAEVSPLQLEVEVVAAVLGPVTVVADVSVIVPAFAKQPVQLGPVTATPEAAALQLVADGGPGVDVGDPPGPSSGDAYFPTRTFPPSGPGRWWLAGFWRR